MPDKPELKEHDGMICRYADCGTFICLICTFRGVTRCKACEEKAKAGKA
jgi:hypothetical protein